MDYKEKYESALERARIWKDKSGMPKDKQGILDDIFPELKESEDERIRKGLIKLINNTCKGEWFIGSSKEECLAWLEKQSEQKPNPYSGVSFEYNGNIWGICARDNGVEIIFDGELKAFLSSEKSFIYPIHPQPELAPKSALKAAKEEKIDNSNKIEPKFKHGDRVRNKKSGLEQTLGSCIEDVYEGTYPFRIKDQDDWELVEHDTAWSKEDEERIKNILSVLDVQVCWDGATLKKVNSYQKEIDWLQSLRQRKSWKPSEEQMEALESATENCAYSEYQDCLRELIEQLKKL